MHPLNKIRCNSIGYRQGFIEILPNIHQGHINIEAWWVHPETDISNIDISDDQISDESVEGNTELEMSIDQAEQLIALLQAAISEVKSSG